MKNEDLFVFAFAMVELSCLFLETGLIPNPVPLRLLLSALAHWSRLCFSLLHSCDFPPVSSLSFGLLLFPFSPMALA